MFLGIIFDIGRIIDLHKEKKVDNVKSVTIASNLSETSLFHGASISCDGVCLTVTDSKIECKYKDIFKEYTSFFTVDISSETLRVTTLKQWTINSIINLEPALRVGDSLGGHYVSGHVDNISQVIDISKQHNKNIILTFSISNELMPFIAERGSIAINGISLTTFSVRDTYFSVNLIPYTYENTNFREIKLGSWVNLEVDVFSRYAVRAAKCL